MAQQTSLIFVIAFVAIVAVVAAMPHPKIVDLADAVNRTVCPIEVDIDEDPDRVPRRIKVIRCAPNPNKFCIEQHIPRHECCDHNHNHHVMECVQIQDKVLVYYPNSESPKKTKLYEVPVGCTCMIDRSTEAVTAT